MHFTSLQPLNNIWRNLTGSKLLTSSSMLVFFRLPDNKYGHPGLWFAGTFLASPSQLLNRIGWNLKQVFDVFYQVLCFLGRSINNDGCFWPRHFPLLFCNCWIDFYKTWQKAKTWGPLISLCFSVWSVNKDGCPSLWFAEIFLTD